MLGYIIRRILVAIVITVGIAAITFELLHLIAGSPVHEVLGRGAKPNLPDDPPWATPIAWAGRRRHAAVVQLLTSLALVLLLPWSVRAQSETYRIEVLAGCSACVDIWANWECV